MRFVVSLGINNFQSRRPDPSNRWDRGDEDGYLAGIYARPLRDYEIQRNPYKYLQKESYSPEWESVEGDYVSVVYALYTTGNSFGRGGLQGCILGVFPISQMEEAKSTLERAEKNPGDEYFPWMGYFEELRGISLQIVRVTSEEDCEDE